MTVGVKSEDGLLKKDAIYNILNHKSVLSYPVYFMALYLDHVSSLYLISPGLSPSNPYYFYEMALKSSMKKCSL